MSFSQPISKSLLRRLEQGQYLSVATLDINLIRDLVDINRLQYPELKFIQSTRQRTILCSCVAPCCCKAVANWIQGAYTLALASVRHTGAFRGSEISYSTWEQQLATLRLAL
jgi:hypothetical protein